MSHHGVGCLAADESSIGPVPILNTLGHPEEKARARTPEQRAYLGGSVLPGLILAAVSAKYCSAGRTTAGDLISSDSIPKNKPIYQFAMKSKAVFLSISVEFY